MFRLLSWDRRPLSQARIPHQVYERVGSVPGPVDWDKALAVGEQHIHRPKSSGFLGFWEHRITEWARQWFRFGKRPSGGIGGGLRKNRS